MAEDNLEDDSTHKLLKDGDVLFSISTGVTTVEEQGVIILAVCFSVCKHSSISIFVATSLFFSRPFIFHLPILSITLPVQVYKIQNQIVNTENVFKMIL